MIRSFIVLATFIVLGLPAAAIFIPWCLITGDVLPLYKVGLFIVRTGMRLVGVRFRVSGLERIPCGAACIFMANHLSNIDPPVLVSLIPGRTSIFLKRSLMKIPILAYGMKLGEFVPVDRGGNTDSARESTRQARLMLEKGVHMTTFVEGTRSADGRLLPFKKGPFYLAMESGAPCVPVSIAGTDGMMPKGSLAIRPGVASLVFNSPLYPSDFNDRDALMEAVRSSITAGLSR